MEVFVTIMNLRQNNDRHYYFVYRLLLIVLADFTFFEADDFDTYFLNIVSGSRLILFNLSSLSGLKTDLISS